MKKNKKKHRDDKGPESASARRKLGEASNERDPRISGGKYAKFWREERHGPRLGLMRLKLIRPRLSGPSAGASILGGNKQRHDTCSPTNQ
jgi:hypothetical protein